MSLELTAKNVMGILTKVILSSEDEHSGYKTASIGITGISTSELEKNNVCSLTVSPENHNHGKIKINYFVHERELVILIEKRPGYKLGDRIKRILATNIPAIGCSFGTI